MRRDGKTHMSRGGGVHTVPGTIGGWLNTMAGSVLSWHDRKRLAVIAGRCYAKRECVEHTIHNRSGVIAEKNSYGNDPARPKDSA